MSQINKDIERILVSEGEINEIVRRIAAEIDRDYAGDDSKLVLLCILKGSVVFMGELMKRISLPVEIDFMKVSSYCEAHRPPDALTLSSIFTAPIFQTAISSSSRTSSTADAPSPTSRNICA